MTEPPLLLDELHAWHAGLRRDVARLQEAVRAALPMIRVSRHRSALWVALWRPLPREGARADLILRFGRPDRLPFTERNQGTSGIPIRWHYALGGRLAARWGS